MDNLDLEKTETQETVPEEAVTFSEDAAVSDTFSDDTAESAEDSDDKDLAYMDKKKKKRKRLLILFGGIFALIIILAVVSVIINVVKTRSAAKNMYTDVAVERRTIQNTITGSSAIEPNDMYSVTTIRSGDITEDYFSEGDTVKKDDKLYQFDDEDARDSLKTAQNALTKAQQSYVDAVKQKSQTVSSNNLNTKSTRNAISRALNTLEDAKDSYDDQYVTSDISGKVKSVSVTEGDKINAGTPIAEVYNDAVMKIRLPFNDYDAQSVYVGADATVYITGSGEAIYGTVTEKSTGAMATDSHTMAVYVTIEVNNPGALTEADTGSAVVNGVACSDTATFEYKDTRTITAEASGTLETLSISKGDSVSAGEQVAYIDSDAAQNSYENAQLSYDDAVLSLEKQVLANDTFSQDSNIKNAQLALDDARTNLKKAQDAVDDYLIEAPIEGTVVTKNSKAGDTIDTQNNTEPLCVIYDLSLLKCSIDVDETEIALVKVGQKATITADAVEGEFEGKVTKVPVDGVNANGVTVYTIEIEIEEYGDLLPGMNVDAEIVVEEADDVLTVPVNSVNRGNIVFIKDDGKERENDVTDIINGAKDADEEDKNKDGKSEEKSDEKLDEKLDEKSDEKSDEMPVVSSPDDYKDGENDGNSHGDRNRDDEDKEESGSSGELDTSSVPKNTQIPDGYRAILVETGINDSSYIEIKSGLDETDMVRALNTKSSSADAALSPEEQMMQNMQSMRNMGGMYGGMGGGMSGGGMGGGGTTSRSGGMGR